MIQISVFIWKLPFSIVNYLENNLSKTVDDLEPTFERVIFVWVNSVYHTVQKVLSSNNRSMI
jgi:hypothetical protein